MSLTTVLHSQNATHTYLSEFLAQSTLADLVPSLVIPRHPSLQLGSLGVLPNITDLNLNLKFHEEFSR